MATPLIVSGNTYNFPQSRDSAGWGDDVTSWAVAVTGVLSNVAGTGDILQTTAAIANNQTTPADILGLYFDPTKVRGAIVEYSVYRTSSTSELVETGTMYLSYKSTANIWDVTVVGGAGSGVTFTMTAAGQVQYVSSNVTGITYNGVIKFRGRALTI